MSASVPPTRAAQEPRIRGAAARLRPLAALLGVIPPAAAAATILAEVVALHHAFARAGFVGWFVLALVAALSGMAVCSMLAAFTALLQGDHRMTAGQLPSDSLRSSLPPASTLRQAPAMRPGGQELPARIADTTPAAAWPTWPSEDELRRSRVVKTDRRTPASEAQASGMRRYMWTPYGLRWLPLAAVIGLATLVTVLYGILSSQTGPLN